MQHHLYIMISQYGSGMYTCSNIGALHILCDSQSIKILYLHTGNRNISHKVHIAILTCISSTSYRQVLIQGRIEIWKTYDEDLKPHLGVHVG
jgi:nitroimidazol reductase NimA-like FMN-containing flavoprotein (pyridoxamine 5'-phosphate oxidase superfamily)